MSSYPKELTRVDHVAAWRLCMGCGACQWACPNHAVGMVDIQNLGLRPLIDESCCEGCGDCVKVCPGIELIQESTPEGAIAEIASDWGPVLAMYRAYAAEADVRFGASSGGIATALALFGLEHAGMAGVLHIRGDQEDSLTCVPVLSTTRTEVLEGMGSRYAPAAPCQAFDLIKQAKGPCLFVGKPCDVAALRKAQAVDSELNAKVGLVVSIFCAGTPSTQGTQVLLHTLGVSDTEALSAFRYRGQGWPGEATAVLVNGESRSMSYEDSWGAILSKHVSLRCRLCPDGTGQFADIACGDMWVERHQSKEGLSNILVRTTRGASFWQQPELERYISYTSCPTDRLPLSQPSLLNKKEQLTGRLAAMRVLGLPTPCYRGFDLKQAWSRVSGIQKIRTLLGTLRRILKRKWYQPMALFKENGSRS